MTAGVSRRKVNVLIVEDNPADVGILRMALGDADLDCELTVIGDGAEVLMFLKREGPYSASPVPDLAIVDLNLPKYDGIEILEAMRANPVFDVLPVAVVSSSAWPREQTRMQALGVVRYIAKPSDLEKYLSIGLILRDLIR
jgi:chemotaxis family two-component system response regulator Rcp1